MSCVFVFCNFEPRKEWDKMQIQYINYINKYFILLSLTNMSCEINYVTKYCKVDGKCDLVHGKSGRNDSVHGKSGLITQYMTLWPDLPSN